MFSNVRSHLKHNIAVQYFIASNSHPFVLMQPYQSIHTTRYQRCPYTSNIRHMSLFETIYRLYALCTMVYAARELSAQRGIKDQVAILDWLIVILR
jgi:hypothetical protein